MSRQNLTAPLEWAKKGEVGFVYLLSDYRTEHDVLFKKLGKPVSKEPVPIDVYMPRNVLTDYGRGPILAMVLPINEEMRKRFASENESGTVMIPGIAANEMEVIALMDAGTSAYGILSYVRDGVIDLHAGNDRFARYAFHHYPSLWKRFASLLDGIEAKGAGRTYETAERIQKEELEAMRKENWKL